MSDYTGQQLGNYRLVKLLGRGGFAEVYEGEHVYLQTRAAIKILHARLADSERTDFLNEAQTIARLQHEHIVRVLEFDVQEETPFLVMEYAPGGTLRDRFPKGKAVPPEQVVTVVQQIASALQYAHEQRLVHRDVKPDNMLLGAEGEILLSDFGIALLLQSTKKSYHGHEVVGTVAYMAPEQIRGQAQPASDQYALAIATYEWLCGERPFRGTNFVSLASQHLLEAPPPLRSKAPHLSPGVEDVVQKALAKDPRQRFACVSEFAQALNDAIGNAPASIDHHPQVSDRYGEGTLRQEMTQGRTLYRMQETAIPLSATVAAQPPVTQHVTVMTRPAQHKSRSVVRSMAVLSVLLVIIGAIVCFSGIPIPIGLSAQRQSIQNYQKLYQQATSGTPVVDDPLTGPDGLNWLIADMSSCHFSAGALHLQLTPQHNADMCTASNFVVSDFAYQVQMTFNAGVELKNKIPAAGLVFRYGGAGTYFMDATVNGFCDFGAASLISGLSYLIHHRACPAFHAGYHQKNVLTAIARGTDLYLYVNGQFFASYSDNTFASGRVGVIAYDGAYDTSFQDARVWASG